MQVSSRISRSSGKSYVTFFLPCLRLMKSSTSAALERARAIERRVERGEVFEAGGLITAQDVAHAVRFKLKDGSGIGASKKLVAGSVVQWQRIQVQFDAAIGGDQLDGVGKHGQRGEAEKIHFQQAETFEALHVVLRRDFVAIGLLNGEQLGKGKRRNHHARGMR